MLLLRMEGMFERIGGEWINKFSSEEKSKSNKNMR